MVDEVSKLELVGVMICSDCLDVHAKFTSTCRVPGCLFGPQADTLRSQVIPLRTVVPTTYLDRAAWRQLERV
jgi:hypothetical protein